MTSRRLVVTLPDRRWLEDLQPWPDGVEAMVWDVASPLSDLGPAAEEVEVVVLPYQQPAQAIAELATMPRLRLVQTLTAGYEGLPEAMPPDVVLANAVGVHHTSTAELAVGLAIASLRGIDDAARDQAHGRWQPRVRRSLADSRVLIVGAGEVGTAIAQRLEAFEVSLTRVASRTRPDDPDTDRWGPVRGVDELDALLPEHDVVILIVPLSQATRGLIDARRLALMPDGALVVNVARGPVVDTDALVSELQTGRLRAAVDVVEPEPPPPDHPIWTAPNVLISPHVGGASTAMVPRARRMLHDQLERLIAGDPPAHVVHPR